MLPTLDTITAKIVLLRDQLRTLGKERIPLDDCCGRVLATPICAFRDSPSLDVSAMDGYALRHEDISLGTLPVRGIAKAGSPPLELEPHTAIQIFTGAVVPRGSECVIPREQCDESSEFVTFRVSEQDIKRGQHIRQRGENAKSGDTVLGSGIVLSGNRIAGIATYLQSEFVDVFRKVNVSVLNTGDELVPVGKPLHEWQIRDSNGPMLQSMLDRFPWVNATRSQVDDELSKIAGSIAESLSSSDAVLLTGGVSMGDTDFVPSAIERAGGRIVFHRIPIRPGRPLLGAVGPQGQLILGLPGNPASVAVTFVRYGLGLLRQLSGMRTSPPTSIADVICEDEKRLDLLWFRLVRQLDDNKVQVIGNQGSGDIAALAQSDGFVEIAPGAASDGSHPFYPWP